MKFKAKVYEPMYEFNNKKYIRFIIPGDISAIIDRMHTKKWHLLKNGNLDIPLDGNILKVRCHLDIDGLCVKLEGVPFNLFVLEMNLKSF